MIKGIARPPAPGTADRLSRTRRGLFTGDALVAFARDAMTALVARLPTGRAAGPPEDGRCRCGPLPRWSAGRLDHIARRRGSGGLCRAAGERTAVAKIALLGTGFGQAHAAAYAQRADVDNVVVFGHTPDKLAAISDLFGDLFRSRSAA